MRKAVYRYNETTTAKINSFTGSSNTNLKFQQQLYDRIYFQRLLSYFTFYMLWGDYLEALSFIEKVSRGLTVKKFRKCLKTLLNDCFSKHHRKEFLRSFLLKNGIIKNCLFVVTRRCIVYSHASGKVFLER